MKKKGKLLAVALAIVLIAGQMIWLTSISADEAPPPTDVSVYVNGVKIDFASYNTAPAIIKERTMVPIRPVADALGYKSEWIDADKRVNVSNELGFVNLVVDVAVMGYALYQSDGEPMYNTRELDSPPVNLGDRVLIPLRPVLEVFGVQVEWDDATKSVLVTADVKPPEPATPAPAPIPTADPLPAVFRTTAYFQEISALRAQNAYDSRETFVMAFYDHKDNEAEKNLPKFQDAAIRAKFKMYGYDSSSPNFAGTSQLPSWVSKLPGYDSRAEAPLVVFSIYRRGQPRHDEIVPVDISRADLDERFQNIASDNPKIITPTPSPSPEPTATANPGASTSTGSDGNDYSRYKFMRLSKEQAQTKYEDWDSFVLVLYNSDKESEYTANMNAIKEAASRSNVSATYIVDMRDESVDGWFIADYYGNRGSIPEPTIFFIYSQNNIVRIEKPRTNDIEEMMERMKSFR